VIAAAWVALLWGGISRHPVWADEAAYLLQADIFASGRWALPAPILPEFFEQYHVLVTPVLAAKYFPGHALVLAIGSLLGVPGLVPILLAGVSGMVLVALAWRVGGVRVAVLTLLLFLLAPISIRFLPSYLSETTSVTAWLVAWWALEHWRRSARLRWLLLVAVGIGWCAITRPLTGVALALPAAVVVLRQVVARHSWAQLAWGVAAGSAVLMLVPLWSRNTTGSWLETPIARYTLDYLPWDRMGIGLDTTAALRSGPPDMARFAEPFLRIHRFHSWANFPTIVGARLAALGSAVWGLAMLVALPLAAYGAWRGPWAARFGLSSSGILFLLYLAYAHALDWNVYYLEVVGPLALCVAFGATLTLTAARGRQRAAIVGVLAAGVGGGLWSAGGAVGRRSEEREAQRYYTDFYRRIDAIPDSAIVFVRYGPDHDPNHPLVLNTVKGMHARVLLAHDLGDADARLIAALPGRDAYRYDDTDGTLTPIGRTP
jgi:hypothetical protein